MHANQDDNLSRTLVSRRGALRGLGGAGVATALALGVPGLAPTTAAHGQPPIEPEAGSWNAWLLTSGDQLRPAAPPDAATTAVELAELHVLAAARDAAALDRIAYWDAGAPGYRWNEIATKLTLEAGMGPEALRVLTYLNAAIYNATIAAWDAKFAYGRPRPGIADASLATAIPTPASPSYPCEHAVAAGTAEVVLAAMFPDAAAKLADLAAEAAHSRVAAGVVYQSDTAAGLDLGRQVGELFIARAEHDGFDAVFDPATMPSGPGIYAGEPAFAAMGMWQTWALDTADQFRPVPPPAWDSAQREAELAEVKNYQRDGHPFSELFFWPQDPAGRPEPDSVPFSSNQVVNYWAPIVHLLWGPELAQKLSEYRLDSNPPRAARAYALVSIAYHDATVACMAAKYFYWTARPNQFDPMIATVLPTYPTPDYPSGHGAGVAAAEETMAYLFPRDAHFFQSRAEECAASRIWAGIHFRSAADAGVTLGRDVAGAVIARARQDGAD